MHRPTQDEYFMQLARVAATRSNCYRRQVGCVMIDSYNRVISTGYNGVPAGYPHCKIGECPREYIIPGEELGLCLAAHAEINAIIQCPNTRDIWKIYVTDSPCLQCTVALLNTPCHWIIFDKEYPGIESEIAWKKLKRKWVSYETIRHK